jgi:hypothetical protein
MSLRTWIRRFVAPPTRADTPADPTGLAEVREAIARARRAEVEGRAAAVAASGRWPHVERIIEVAEQIRSRNHLADDIRTVLGGTRK